MNEENRDGSWADGKVRILDLPSSRAADCENAGCQPPSGVLWNGQWQAPSGAECPVCTTSFPVVNACVLNKAEGSTSTTGAITLYFGGYGRTLHAWRLNGSDLLEGQAESQTAVVGEQEVR